MVISDPNTKGKKMKVKWFDNETAENKFVLEMLYENGNKGYLKNEDYKTICHYYDLFWDNCGVVAMTLFNKSGEVVADKCRAAVA